MRVWFLYSFTAVFLVYTPNLFSKTKFERLKSSELVAEIPSANELLTKFEHDFKKSGLSSRGFSLYATIGEGDQQKVVADVNSNQMVIPASVTKIFTSSAVFEKFPLGHKFKTQLLSDSKIENGILRGPLYLKGGGDPSFVSENMWYIVNQFLRNKITEVSGDIIVDDSLFDKMRYDSSRQSERVDRAYDAPVGAMSFNWNSINIFVRPSNVGEVAQVFLDPINNYTQLINQTKTVSGDGNGIIVERKESSKGVGDQIILSGKIGKDIKEIVVYKNITNPDYWSGYNLKSFLEQRGIKVNGEVKVGIAPSEVKILAEYESKGIEQIVSDMNKFSNNYVAEMLTKNLGTLKKQPATLEDGMEVIRQHLIDIGIPKDQFYIENPSGLTRKNKFSAFALWKVLLHLKNDFRVQPEFSYSLPISSVDGTLKKRFKNGPGERWVRGKTGYINSVVSLAGYAGRKDGRVITFAFMYNGETDEAKMRNFFDHWIENLVK